MRGREGLLLVCLAACSSHGSQKGTVEAGTPEAGEDAADSSDDTTTMICSPSLTLINIGAACAVGMTEAIGLCVTEASSDAASTSETVCLLSPANTWFVAQVGPGETVTGDGWQAGPTSFATAQHLAALSATDEAACKSLLAAADGGLPALCTSRDAATD